MAQWTFNAPSNGYKFRITLTDVNVNVPGNTSQVAWVIEHYQYYTSYNGVMNRFLDIDGQIVYSANNTYNTTGYAWNSWWTVASGTSGAIGHNPDGSKTISVHFYWSGTSGGYGPGTVDQWFNFTLTTIPRYANFTSITSTNITDAGFTANFSVDATCDRYATSLDNGSNWSAWTNVDFTSQSTALGGNLPSNSVTNWKVKVRNKSSGLETVSGTQTVTTLPQNNFIGFF